MRFLMIAMLALLAACAPTSGSPTRNVAPEAKPYARMILEGPESLDALAALAIVTDGGNTGLYFLGFNEERSAVATSYIPLAGLPSRIFFVAEDIKQGDAVTGTLFRILTDPSPPPVPRQLDVNLVKLAEALKAKLGEKLYGIKLEREP
jgi:hypothetical protein